MHKGNNTNYKAKKMIIGLLLLTGINGSYGQQWSGSSNTTSNIYRTGNVGINITAPSSKLGINGNMAVGFSTAVSAPTNGLVVNGRVGIGTSSPNSLYKLHLATGAQQIGPNWITSGSPWYLLGISNINTSGNTDAIVNLNSESGQSGIELFRQSTQKWYIYNRPNLGDGINQDALCFFGGHGTQTDKMIITQDGNVGIGAYPGSSYRLVVEGKIGAREIVVTKSSWADYVFKNDYNLKSLSEVEKHIKQHKHLEGIPSQEEVVKNGVSIGDMQEKLLQKVEELTLYVIEQNKKIENLQDKIKSIEKHENIESLNN